MQSHLCTMMSEYSEEDEMDDKTKTKMDNRDHGNKPMSRRFIVVSVLMFFIALVLVAALVYREVSLGHKIKVLTNGTETLEAEKSALADSVAVLEAEKFALADDVASLEADKTKAAARMALLESEKRSLADDIETLRASLSRLSPATPPTDANWSWVQTNLDKCMSERFDWARNGDYDIERLKAFTGLDWLTRDLVVKLADDAELELRKVYTEVFQRTGFADRGVGISLWVGMRHACWDLGAENWDTN